MTWVKLENKNDRIILIKSENALKCKWKLVKNHQKLDRAQNFKSCKNWNFD